MSAGKNALSLFYLAEGLLVEDLLARAPCRRPPFHFISLRLTPPTPERLAQRHELNSDLRIALAERTLRLQ